MIKLLTFALVCTFLPKLDCANAQNVKRVSSVYKVEHLVDKGRSISQQKNSSVVSPYPKWLKIFEMENSNANLQVADKNENQQCLGEENKTFIPILSEKGRLTVTQNIENLDANSIYVFRLSRLHTYGFSEESRESYIKTNSVDPKDLYYWNFGDEVVDRWYAWRQDRITDVVTTFSSEVRRRDLPFRIGVDSELFTAPINWKQNAGENWFEWVKIGLIDEIVIEGNWEKPEGKQLLTQAREALAGTNVKMRVALDLRRDGKAIDPLVQLLNLQGEKIDGIVVKVEDEADLPRAQKFVDEVLPEFAFGLGLQEKTILAPTEKTNATP